MKLDRRLLLSALLPAACVAAGCRPSVEVKPSRERHTDGPRTSGSVSASSDASSSAARSRSPEPDYRELPMDWLSAQGTSIVGFGLLRLEPTDNGPARFRIDYRDSPDGYGVTDNAQLFVLRGDAFAERPMAYGHDLLAFAFEPGEAPDVPPSARASDYVYPGDGFAPTIELSVEVTIDEPGTYLVAYGAWTDPDTGRPPGDRHTFDLHVTPLDDGQGPGVASWIESEAGELITSNWSHRPMLARGEPVRPEVFHGLDGAPPKLHLEIRPLILYDFRLARAVDEEPDLGLAGMPRPGDLLAEAEEHEAEGRPGLALDCRDRAADLIAVARRRDHHLVLTKELAAKFRKVPIRWR